MEIFCDDFLNYQGVGDEIKRFARQKKVKALRVKVSDLWDSLRPHMIMPRNNQYWRLPPMKREREVYVKEGVEKALETVGLQGEVRVKSGNAEIFLQ